MENPTNSNSASKSPEFEFWMVRNPSSQQTPLHSADQLFSGGILLPLRLLNTDHPPDVASVTPHIHGSDLKTTVTTASKRWKDIFKKNPEETKHKKKNKDRNSGSTAPGVGTATAELNINLWPFSRSRSAGNIGSRPRTVVGNRKVSSAPCSRSNSTGDKHRKWPSSPGRAGVHLGRSSPVWQAKRFGQSRSLHDGLVAEKGYRPTKNSATGAGANSKVLDVSVPACIGYRQRMRCESHVSKENPTADVRPGGEGGGSALFNFRSLFTKRVF